MIEIHIKPEEILRIGNFPITNSFLTTLLISVTIIIFSFFLGRRMSLVPGFLQNLFELIIENILKIMNQILKNSQLAEKYLPLVVTIFLFVLSANWFGILPGVGSFGLQKENFIALLRPPSTDLNFTIALALVAIFAINIFGSLTLGVGKHFSKFFNLKSPIFSFVGLLEFISECVKIVSFAFRLFGNIFAGKVLLLIIAFLVPYFIPMPFLALEIFVGFIQAFIFTMLTLVFIAMAVQHNENH